MKSSAYLVALIFAGISLASFACTKTVEKASPSGESPTEPSTKGDGGGKDGGPAQNAATPKAECEAYLACVNEATPETGGTAVALYGDDSPCWKGSASDAKSCGDACRLARVSVARDDEASHCGCDSDSECKGFCSSAHACVEAYWAGILEACESFAKDAKVALAKWRKENDYPLPCAAIENANCGAIRGLAFRGAYAEDSESSTVQADALRDYYAAKRTGDVWGLLSSNEQDDGAPATCSMFVTFGLTAARTMRFSADLRVYVEN